MCDDAVVNTTQQQRPVNFHEMLLRVRVIIMSITILLEGGAAIALRCGNTKCNEVKSAVGEPLTSAVGVTERPSKLSNRHTSARHCALIVRIYFEEAVEIRGGFVARVAKIIFFFGGSGTLKHTHHPCA
jgi:hypothetical protein